MEAFDTRPSGDPEAIADLAAAALEQDPDDWRPAQVAAHLAVEHPQIAGRSSWPDDSPYAAHDNDHRDWIYDHTHDRSRSRPEAADALFNELNPDFGVLPDGHDPQQHRFAANREQALLLGTRAAEALRAHNHPDAQRREHAVAGVAPRAELRAAGYKPPTREGVRRTSDLNPRLRVPQRPVPELTRSGPER
jgi:hypothetical protein